MAHCNKPSHITPLILALWAGPLALAVAPSSQAAQYSESSILEQNVTLNLKAGPLAQRLSEFSQQTGISLIYTESLPLGAQAPAVQGQFKLGQALKQLLQGSGMHVRPVNDSTLTLEADPVDSAEAGSMDLSAISITGNDLPFGNTSYQPATTASIMRTKASVLEIPQTVNVVAAQVIKDQKPRNLDDALNNISGITQANTLGGTQDAVTKRGFGENRDGSIMRDGIPSVLGRNMTASVDHVEVLKGPATLLYGIQDPGGVVNLVSKKPELTQRTHLTARGASYGDDRTGSGGQLDTTGSIGNSRLAYRLIVDYEDDEYWRNFGTRRDRLIAPSLAWYGDDTSVNLSYEHRSFSYPFDRGTAIDPVTKRPLDISRRRRLDESFNVTEGRSDLMRLSLDHQFNEQWSGNLSYGWTREVYDDNQARVTAVNTAKQTVTRRIDGTHGAVSTNSFGRASLSGSFDWLGMRHDIMTGIDSEKRKIFRADLIRGGNSSLSYTNPVYGAVGTSSTVDNSTSNQRDELRTDSIYVQDSIHLNEQWILVLGTRYQRYDQWAGRGEPFKANTDVQDQEWTPRAGLVYRLNDMISLYGSYTYSFKPNSTIAPLSNGQVLSSSTPPEEARSWEIGGKLDIPGGLTTNLALFDIHKRNVLITQLDEQGDSYSRAAGKVQSYGLELDVSGELTERWSLVGSYAWLHAEVTKDPELEDNRLQNVPKTTASLSAVYDAGTLFGNDRLRLGGGLRYVGKRSGDADNSFTLPSYSVADLFANYTTKLSDDKDLSFQLNVKNLFDKTYYPSAGNQYYVAVGEARQFLFSTTLSF